MMQLILETEPSGDIKTNMSLEVDTANSNITELKNDVRASKGKNVLNDIICDSVNNVTMLTETEFQRELSNLNTGTENLNYIEQDKDKANDNPTCGANIDAEENSPALNNIDKKVSEEIEIKNGLKDFVLEEMDVDPKPDSLNNISNNISSSENHENVDNSNNQDELDDKSNDISVTPHNITNGPSSVVLKEVEDFKMTDSIKSQENYLNPEIPENSANVGNKDTSLTDTSNLLSKDETKTALFTDGERDSDTSKTLNVLPCVETKSERKKMVDDTDEGMVKDPLVEEKSCELDETKEILTKEIEMIDDVMPVEVDTKIENSSVTSDEISQTQEQTETPNQMVSMKTPNETFTISDKSNDKPISEGNEIINDDETSIDNVENCVAVSHDKTISIEQENITIATKEINKTVCSDNEEVSKNAIIIVPEQKTIEILNKNIDLESKKLHASEETVSVTNAMDVSEILPNALDEIVKDAVDKETTTNNSSKNGVIDYKEKVVEKDMDSDITKKQDEDMIHDVTRNQKEITNENVNTPMDVDIPEEIKVNNENVSENNSNANEAIAKNIDTDVKTAEEISATGMDTFEKQSNIEKANPTCNIKDGSDVTVNNMPMDVDALETDHLTETLCENSSSENIVNNEVSLSNSTSERIPSPEIAPTATNEFENKRESELVDLENDATEAPPSHSPEITTDTESNKKETETKSSDNVEVIDEDDINIIEDDDEPCKSAEKEKITENKTKTLPVVCKLSNTLDILSEEEDEEPSKEAPNTNVDDTSDKQCISIDDDDDIMLIEEDSNHKESVGEKSPEASDVEPEKISESPPAPETPEKEVVPIDITELSPKINEKEEESTTGKVEESVSSTQKVEKLLPENFLTTAKKNLADMTRDDLEEFCILKIVESIVDRSGLGEIKNKMKQMARSLEEYRKKALALSKQNRDLQVVLKTIQEEQKKRPNGIQPMKITRSVGMQVLMTDKMYARRQGPIPSQIGSSRPIRTPQNKNPAAMKPASIPFPRLVPANNSATAKATNSPVKPTSPILPRNVAPVQKAPEKRPPSRSQSSSSVTVDLTDDEPPAKIKAKNSPGPPVRVVPSHNLMPQQKIPPFGSPRKVYIPINGPQGQALRPGQTVIMKTVPTGASIRPRVPGFGPTRFQATPLKVDKVLRHPAPLPDAVKQYTPAAWKPLPPAPDLKLSKVENGIVISWKIDGVPENSYESVVSYQLYAYQETTAPPSTSLWKKIGDVKALPLPMACTLTQFMAGYKYYFAVRAVDIRSRLGPFSVPGSILLLSKV